MGETTKIIFNIHDFNTDFEIVERKGIGHPDTIADHLAEHLSREYAKWTKTRFGAVLHHNFDKVGLLGGKSKVRFGHGEMISPIRILINGRASYSFGDEEFDVWQMLAKWTRDFMMELFPMLNAEKDLLLINNLSTASSPGQQEDNGAGSARNFWFQPRSLEDLPEHRKLFSNDTSLGVGYAPYSILDKLILNIEGKLNSAEYKIKKPYVGSDIKIMGCRKGNKFYITLCVPQIASYVKNVKQYLENLKTIRADIEEIIRRAGISDYELDLNTRDSVKNNEFYLTAIGSSIESGDEGLVGRGNRINGLITPNKIMSMEGAAGKNPVYHIGKIYHLMAQNIADEIFEKTKKRNQVSVVSQSGRDLDNPWIVVVELEKQNEDDKKIITEIIEQRSKQVSEITDKLLLGQYRIS